MDDTSKLKEVIAAQSAGLRRAYLDDLRSLDTCKALENLSGLLMSIPKLPLRHTSGLVELQSYFRRFADDHRSHS